MAEATRYYTADGYYCPGANAPDLLAKKERLHKRLEGLHDDFQKLNKSHENTEYGCMQAGKCCTVGLVVHTLEIEYLARHLKARFKEDPAYEERITRALLERFEDHDWTMEEGIGEMQCAMYENGCTVYPARPSVCRMYGSILEINEDCPRKRLSSGREFIWIRPEADAAVRSLYRTVDEYGKLFPRADCSRYLPAGLAMFLLPKEEVDKLKARTRPKFWQTLHGYRSQFQFSKKQEPFTEKVPRFPVTLKLNSYKPKA